jgi:O-antigen ligase
MVVRFSSLVFFGLFWTLFLSILFLEETSYILPIMGVFTLLFCFFHRKMRAPSSQFTPSLLLSLLLLIVGGASLFFTLSLPLSLERFFFFLFGFICFVFFTQVDSQWCSTKMLLTGIFRIGLVLTVFSLLLTFFPNLLLFFPRENLFTTSFGHNHLAIYTLLLIPLAWKNWEEKRSNWSFGVILFLNVALLLSFARIAQILGFCELVTLFFARRHLFKVSPFKILALLSPLILGIVTLFTLSLFPIFSSQQNCIAPFMRTQLCKPLIKESRPAYWLQAVRAFQTHPFTGWGGGTFPVLSTKFARNLSDHYSMYTHNEFLQTFAEYGIFGGFIFLFFCGLILKESLQIFHKEKSDAFFLSLAVISFIIDACFDFNWHFLGIWLLFLLTVVLLYRSSTSPKIAVKTFQKWHRFFFPILKVTWWISCAAMMMWTGVFSLSSVAWIMGQYDLSLTLFPFSEQRVEKMIDSDKITQERKVFLINLYQAHPRIIKKYLSNLTDPQQKIHLLHSLITVNPWDLNTRVALLQLLVQEKEWSAYVQALDEFSHQFKKEWWHIPELTRQAILKEIQQQANSVVNEKVLLSEQMYLTIYGLEPAAINDYPFDLLLRPDQYSESDVLHFLNELQPQTDLWFYQKPLTRWYWQYAEQHKDWEIIRTRIKDQLGVHPTSEWDIWDISEPEVTAQFNRAYNAGHFSEAQQIIEAWHQVLNQVKGASLKNGYKIENQYNDKIVKNYLKLIDQYAISPSDEEVKAQIIIKNYEFALQLQPELLHDQPFFFEKYSEHSPNWKLISTFIDQLFSARNTTLLFQRPQPSMKILQKLLNYDIEKQDWDAGLHHAYLLSEIFKQDYWASTQLGNYYLLRGQTDLALQTYKECIAYFGAESDDRSNCSWGVYFIEHHRSQEELFWQASDQILYSN